MADVTLHPNLQRFPVGTTVTARKRSNWPSHLQDSPSGTPGAADDSSTVSSDGSLLFEGLTEETRYVAHANVASTDRYFHFTATSSEGAIEVVNPDRTSIGSGGGGGDATEATLQAVETAVALLGTEVTLAAVQAAVEGTLSANIVDGAVGVTSVYFDQNGQAVDVEFVVVNWATDGESGALIAAPAAGFQIAVLSYTLNVTGGTGAQILSGSGGAVMERLKPPGAAVSSGSVPLFFLGDADGLFIDNDTGSDTEGRITYVVLPV